MSTAYWRQWDHSELMSMLGRDVYDHSDESIDSDYHKENDTEENERICHRCSDNGCQYCSAVTW